MRSQIVEYLPDALYDHNCVRPKPITITNCQPLKIWLCIALSKFFFKPNSDLILKYNFECVNKLHKNNHKNWRCINPWFLIKNTLSINMISMFVTHLSYTVHTWLREKNETIGPKLSLGYIGSNSCNSKNKITESYMYFG